MSGWSADSTYKPYCSVADNSVDSTARGFPQYGNTPSSASSTSTWGGASGSSGSSSDTYVPFASQFSFSSYGMQSPPTPSPSEPLASDFTTCYVPYASANSARVPQVYPIGSSTAGSGGDGTYVPYATSSSSSWGPAPSPPQPSASYAPGGSGSTIACSTTGGGASYTPVANGGGGSKQSAPALSAPPPPRPQGSAAPGALGSSYYASSGQGAYKSPMGAIGSSNKVAPPPPFGVNYPPPSANQPYPVDSTAKAPSSVPVPAPPPQAVKLSFLPAPAPVPQAAVTPVLPPQPSTTGREKEPMMLLGVTKSMTLRTSPLVVRPRFEMLCICLKYLVPKLSEDDDAAEVEQEGGGVRTITYSDGSAKDMDDFNADELEEQLGELTWEGATIVVPGWQAMLKAYEEEVVEEWDGNRHIIEAVVVSDGTEEDAGAFLTILRSLPADIFVVIITIGDGGCIKAYRTLALNHPRLRVMPIETDTKAPKQKAFAKAVYDAFVDMLAAFP